MRPDFCKDHLQARGKEVEISHGIAHIIPSTGKSSRQRRSPWFWIGIAVVTSLVVLLILAEVAIHRAGPILTGRITETLSASFHGRTELENLNISVLHGLEVSGDHLRIYSPAD